MREGAPILLSERFEEFDERALVIIAETRLLLEVARAEIMATVYHEVRTFANRQEAIGETGKKLRASSSPAPGQSFKRFFQIVEQLHDISRMTKPFRRIVAFGRESGHLPAGSPAFRAGSAPA